MNKNDRKKAEHSAKEHAEPNVEAKEVASEAAAPKNEPNYKALWEEALQERANLELRLAKLTEEHKAQTKLFHDKAVELSAKAQNEVAKHRDAMETKYQAEHALIKKYGSQKLLEDMLEPLINLQLAIQFGATASDVSVQNYVIGFKMLIDQINNVLKHHHVVPILPKVGDHFDPTHHEAIGKEHVDPAETILEVKRLGYAYHDRVIKPAKVIIATGSGSKKANQAKPH